MKLPHPGSDFGPCTAAGPCAHPFCNKVRALAARECFFCGQPIGYDVEFRVTSVGADVYLTHDGPNACRVNPVEVNPRPNTRT